MASAGVGSPAFTLLALAAFVCSGCLGGPSSKGADSPSDSTPDDAGPVEVFSPGWPAVDEAVIRPGAKIVTGALDALGRRESGICTANFVFSTPDNLTLYLGTASHCVTGLAIGDPVSIAAGRVTGTLVYCSWGTVDGTDTCPDKVATDEGWANDFALVELPPDSRSLIHPALLHWGGPTGIVESPPGADVHVLAYGNSSLRDADQGGPGSDAADAREGITSSPSPTTPIAYPGYSAEWTTYVRFAPPGVQGDLGGPGILPDGSALGIVNAFIPFEGANAVTLLNPAIEYLHHNTDFRIELKTWTTLADPIVPLPAPDEGAPRRSLAEGEQAFALT